MTCRRCYAQKPATSSDTCPGTCEIQKQVGTVCRLVICAVLDDRECNEDWCNLAGTCKIPHHKDQRVTVTRWYFDDDTAVYHVRLPSGEILEPVFDENLAPLTPLEQLAACGK